MNETPESPPPGDDDLAGALGDALRDAPDDLVIPPPVADIAERAAAKARARNTRRTVGSIAASVMLVAGGVVAWNSANDGEPDQQEVAVESVDDPAEASALEEDAADSAASTSASAEDSGPGPGLADVDPAEYSTAAPLTWAEIGGPADGGGSLMTLPDGRVMVRLWSGDGADQVLVTDDGETWTPVPMPQGVSPNFVDLGDELWVVTGWDTTVDAVEFGDGVYVSSDQGTTWQTLDVPGLDETNDSYLVTRGYIGAAAAFGDQAVVAVSSFTDVDFVQIAIDQGIASSPEQVYGWGTTTDENDVTTVTIDVGPASDADREPFASETFTFTPDELGLPSDVFSLHGGPENDFTIFLGDAAGLVPVADFDGNPARMLVAGDELVLTGFSGTGAAMWTSNDATTWTMTDVGDSFEVAGRFQDALWGGGWSPDGFVIERLGGSDVERVATFPGLSLNSLLSAGPSGIAATVTVEVGSFDEEAFPVEPFDDEEFPVAESGVLEPGVMASRNGIELRRVEPSDRVVTWWETRIWALKSTYWSKPRYSSETSNGRAVCPGGS